MSEPGHYTVHSKIGEGTYGSVFKATDQRDGSEVAIKRMKNTREGDGISHTAYREIALVRELPAHVQQRRAPRGGRAAAVRARGVD